MLRIRPRQPYIKASLLGLASVAIGSFAILGVFSTFSPSGPVIVIEYQKLPEVKKQVALAGTTSQPGEGGIENAAWVTPWDSLRQWDTTPKKETSKSAASPKKSPNPPPKNTSQTPMNPPAQSTAPPAPQPNTDQEPTPTDPVDPNPTDNPADEGDGSAEIPNDPNTPPSQ